MASRPEPPRKVFRNIRNTTSPTHTPKISPNTLPFSLASTQIAPNHEDIVREKD